MLPCPLCTHESESFAVDRWRAYFRCLHCRLVFVDPESHLSGEAEKAIYDLHENDPADPRYRRFLSRLAIPLQRRLRPGMQGLDYGCGPGPTLSVMLEEAGMQMALYDPYYRPNRDVLDRQFDFVTCTEVVEHFNEPVRDWKQLVSLLSPGGWLGVLTRPVVDRERFMDWHYKNDLTHVSFYDPMTFAWLGWHFGLDVEQVDQNVFLLQKH